MITQQNAETPIGEIPMGRLFAPTFFRWASATATGRLHEVNCEASQDAHALDQFDDPSGNRWLVTAVADGAGSALDGGTGAQIAASAFIEAIALLIAEGKMDDFNIGLKAAVTFARLEIDIVALIAGHDVSHYATTLLGVVTDGNRIGVVQVGDGAVVVGPPWRVVHTPDRGEYINEATFLTAAEWFSSIQIEIGTQASPHVLLMTDGVSDLVIDQKTGDPHQGFCGFIAKGFERPIRGSDTACRDPLSGDDAVLDDDRNDLSLSEQLQGVLETPDFMNALGDDATVVAVSLRETVPCPAP